MFSNTAGENSLTVGMIGKKKDSFFTFIESQCSQFKGQIKNTIAHKQA